MFSRRQSTPEITVLELKKNIDDGDGGQVIDVRSQEEYDFVNIQPSTLIPMNDIADVAATWDKSQALVIMCRSGARSASVVDYRVSQGFENVKNLKGGILAWAHEIDPSLPQY